MSTLSDFQSAAAKARWKGIPKTERSRLASLAMKKAWKTRRKNKKARAAKIAS